MEDFKMTPLQRGQITRAINTLNRVRRELEKNNPDAPNVNWYLEDCGNFNLMSDDSHTGLGAERNKGAVVSTWDLRNSSGGGW